MEMGILEVKNLMLTNGDGKSCLLSEKHIALRKECWPKRT